MFITIKKIFHSSISEGHFITKETYIFQKSQWCVSRFNQNQMKSSKTNEKQTSLGGYMKGLQPAVSPLVTHSFQRFGLNTKIHLKMLKILVY